MKAPAKLIVVNTSTETQSGEDRLRVRLVVELVALAMDVPADQIRSPSRNNARAARARQAAMYLAYVAWQWPLARVGEAFGRDRTTVGHACRVIEDLRDDRRFDQTLDRLESALAGLPAALEFKAANFA